MTLSANDPDYDQSTEIYEFENWKQNLDYDELLEIIGWSDWNYDWFCAEEGLHPDDDHEKITELLFGKYDKELWRKFNG